MDWKIIDRRKSMISREENDIRPWAKWMNGSERLHNMLVLPDIHAAMTNMGPYS